MTTDNLLMELAEKYARQSAVLSIAATRNGAVRELLNERERIAKALDVCKRFPCFVSFLVRDLLEGK